MAFRKMAVAFLLLSPLAMKGQPPSMDKRQIFQPTTKIFFVKLGNRNVPIQVSQYGDFNGIVCINLHDDEFTSVNAAMQVLSRSGGTLIKIQNSGERMIRFRINNHTYKFDPNRMFSTEGIEASLDKNGKSSPEAVFHIDRFARRLLEQIPENSPTLIALHNNTPGRYSVKSYLPGGDLENDAKEVYQNPDQDEDAIALATDSVLFSQMKEFGYNSILQDNEKARRDGSLSVYFGEKNRSYINIETEHGRLSQYREMLEKLILQLIR